MKAKNMQAYTDYKKTWASLLHGHDAHIKRIARAVDAFMISLHPPGRPAGVFLLGGPTGVGKTHTVRSLAAALHGSDRNLVTINCTEFQMEHEVAKLIGAPPGYLGHRETTPMLNQQKLNSGLSGHCGVSLVLFDEIEKAAPSMQRLLLNVLDTAQLKLGDGTSVNFEKSLIFFTTNLGAQSRVFGNAGFLPSERDSRAATRQAAARHFSPEFMNRVDATLNYEPLTDGDLVRILNLELENLNQLIRDRHGPIAYRLELTANARRVIIDQCEPERFGARELKRLLHNYCVEFLLNVPNCNELGVTLTLEYDPESDQLMEQGRSGKGTRTRKAR